MFDNYYGLSAKPFQLTPDPDFYFATATHRKAQSYLGYGLAQGEGFIVITGEVGAGKSTLVAHMVANVDPAQMRVAQIVTSKLDEDEVVHVVAQAFGLDIAGHDKASALGAIEAHLNAEANAGRRCLLVVDEAQNLSVNALEELRMLSNFQQGNQPLLQTLLLGQPEFRATLQTHPELEQLRQRVIASHHLGPMEREELEPYLAHRLQHVGWEGNPAFDQRVYLEMYEASGGIPRKVNQIANRVLLLGAVEQRQRIDALMLQSVLKEMEGERVHAKPQAVVAEKLAENVAEKMAEPVLPAAPATSIDRQTFEDLLAERDAQIAEFQQAVVEFSEQREHVEVSALQPDIQVLQEQIAKLQASGAEQEQTIRHTLTMLIEWIEGDLEQNKAA
jgi:putative secretion ATPase (PEP-CTERM system associated)